MATHSVARVAVCALFAVLSAIALLSASRYSSVFISSPQEPSAVVAQPQASAQSSAMSGALADDFEKFIEKFKKEYVSLEEKVNRFEIFRTNVKYVDEHNQKGASYQLSVNHFADYTVHELKEKILGLFHHNKTAITAEAKVNDELSNVNVNDLPKSVDWREKGCVSEVKDQKQCGSCWAFSTTGAVEGAWCAAGNGQVNLSEQQLVDCGAKEGNAGCQGGLMTKGLQYVVDNNGLCSEDDYPYIARRHWLKGCMAKKCKSQAHIKGYEVVPPNDEKALAAAVAKYGPISIGIQANIRDFMLYHGGVFDAKCGDELDHGVLLVGYGNDESTKQDYWVIKNSWGPRWGEKGFIRMVRNTSPDGKIGECGLASVPAYAVVDHEDKPTVSDNDSDKKDSDSEDENDFPFWDEPQQFLK